MTKAGKGGRKPTKAQAGDSSRFAADAAGVEAAGRIIDETATVRYRGASATFKGVGAGDRAREWLEKAHRDYLAAQNEH